MAQLPAYDPVTLANKAFDANLRQLLDTEHNNIQAVLDAARANLKAIQRDDQKLANDSVHPDALDIDTLGLMGSWVPKGDWVTGTAYAIGDQVRQSAQNYVCVIAHTAGTFATDLSNGRWMAVGAGSDLVLDEDDFASDSASKASSQQATAAYISTRIAPKLDEADSGLFNKADPDAVAWTKTAAFTAETAQALDIEVNGSVVNIASGTSITMPGSATAGTDYTIWLHPDGTLEATSSYSSGPVANARRVGGFHYAPGGNASAQAGGDTTPAINEHSFWDLKWRPACPDPRGMTLVAEKFWTDIYLLGVDHHLNGTSAHSVTIADGSAPPKVPSEFGGDGSTVYSDGNWWNLTEVLAAHGKRPPTYEQFAALAYGVTEAAARGSDPVTTGLSDSNSGSSNTDEKFTSKWGVIQASGCLSSWGANFGGDHATAAWSANTGGRGSTYMLSNVARFGGAWSVGSDAGSRCSIWSNAPTNSANHISVRGCCDHLRLD